MAEPKPPGARAGGFSGTWGAVLRAVRLQCLAVLLAGCGLAAAQQIPLQAPEPHLVRTVSVPRLAIRLDDADRQWLAQRHVLRIGVVAGDFPPFDLVGLSNEYSGISADILAAVAESLDLQPQVKVFASRDLARRALRNAEVDLLTSVPAWGGNRELLLSQPFTALRHVEISARERRVDRGTEITVGYVAGHVTEQALHQAYPQAHLVAYPSPLLGVSAVMAHKIDLFIDLAATASYLIDHYQIIGLRVDFFGQGTSPSMHFGLRADSDRLASLVNRALEAVPPRAAAEVRARWAPRFDSQLMPGRIQLNGAEQAWIAGHPVVRYVHSPDFMPFMFNDHTGRPAGLALQLMDRVTAETGLRFEAVAPGQEAQAELMPAVVRGQALPPGMEYTRAYFHDHWVLVGRAEQTDVQRLVDLRGKRMAFFPPNQVAEVVHQRVPGLTLLPMDSVAATFEAVANGSADVTLGNIETVNYIVRQFYADQLKVVGAVDDTPVDIGYALRGKQPMLETILEKGLESVSDDEMRQLRANAMFFRRPVTDWRVYVRWLAIGGALLLVGLTMFALWARSLRKEVRQRVLAQEELRDQLAFQRAMLEGMPQAISVRDAQGRLTYCNAAFERLFRVPRSAVLGKTLPQSPVPNVEPQLLRTIHERYVTMLSDGRPLNEDVDAVLDGQPRRLLHWAAPIRLRVQGEPVALVSGAIDMTERHHLLELIESARAKAEAANRAKSNFLATMSHEIRTPMNAVLGMLELLLREGRLNPVDRASADLAAGSARALLSLIDDILDISKIEAGGLDVVPRPTRLRPLIHEVASVFDGMARRRGLYVRVEIDERVAACHAVDGPRFRQIVNNLVSNAIKYSDQGGVTIRLLHQEMLGELESLVLEVQDTGIGIAPKDVQNLFKPFFQAEAAGPRTIGGTGLGLPIVQRLCMRMGGDIGVTSQQGVGTTISVALRLPVVMAPSDEESANSLDASAELTGAALEGWHVLVVDDHPANRVLLQRQLDFLGLRCELAENGAQALELWRNEPFDAVITDFSMPVMDGHALAAAIRKEERAQQRPRCPILGCTAHVQEAERRHALDAGMDECLMKPISVDQLREALLRFAPARASGVRGASDAPATAADRGSVPDAAGRVADGWDSPAEAFELSALREISGGDATVEASFLDTMLRANAADAAELARLVADEAHAQTASCGHKIKGAARLLHAHAVVDDCESLEVAAHAGDAAAVAQAHARLLRSLEAFDAAMRAHLKSIGALAH